jgi:predicted RNase H-like HicB family nuclease
MTRTYTVVLLKDADGGYGVYVPAIPGCYSQGDNLAHALAMAREAIELHLEVTVEDGEPVPRDTHDFRLRMNGAKSGVIRRVQVMVPEAVQVAS